MNKQLYYCNMKSILFSICLFIGTIASVHADAVLGGFDPITFNVGDVSGEVGEIVCVDVTVEDFIRVESFTFGINYNSNLLSVINPVDVSNSPLPQSDFFFNTQNDIGAIFAVWFDPNLLDGDGVTVDDGTVIFSLCFQITGTCGLQSPVTISSFPIEIEVSQADSEGTSCTVETLIANNGSVNIICPTMTINTSACNASASNDDGTISFYIAGGSGNYSYTVNPVGISGSSAESELIELEGLSAGTYTIIAIDNDTGETIDINQAVTDIGSIQISLDATDPTCFNKDRGSIEATTTNSFGDPISAGQLNYEWSNFRFTEDIEDLGSGTYTVTVTDFNGCSATETTTLFVETLLLQAELIDSASCEGNNDATVKIWAEGGTPFPPMPNPEYNFETDAGDTSTPTDTFFLDNVESGPFEFAVFDAAQPTCIVDSIIDIPFKGIDLSIEIDTVNISCFGANDGSATITALGSTNFSIQVRDDNNMLLPGGSFPTVRTVTDLSAGCYTVLVIESFNGCEITGSFCIEEPAVLELTEDEVINPGCVGDDGEISLNTSGGTMPYTYMWSDGPSMDEDRTGLVGDTYTVTVTDDRGCSDTATFVLPDGSDVQIDANVIQAINCPQDQNGIIEVVISTGGNFVYNWETPNGTFVSDMQTVSIIHLEGTSPFTYLWDDLSTEQVIGGISEGTYFVTVTDANQCEPEMAGTYSFFWSNDPTNIQMGASSSQSGFPAGENWVIAADFSCISDTIFFTIPDIDSIAIDLDNSTISSPSCFGDCDGIIDVAATGGNPSSYTYMWLDDGSSNTMRTDLCAGIYQVEIMDANGCTVTRSVELSYTWTNNVSTESIASELEEGTYTIQVTDDKGCTAETSLTLTAPEPLVAVLNEAIEPECFGDLTCISFASVTGGSDNDYTYQIQNGPNLPIDSCALVFANTYTITVADGTNSCSQELTITIDQPDQIFVDAGPDQEIDLGSSSDVISPIIDSSLPISDIIWTPLDSLDCLDTDCEEAVSNTLNDILYTVTVVDENGCSAKDDIFITVNTSRNVYIPNIFTPDGDGANDFFNIVIGSGAVSVSYLSIFDRWGNRVFAIENEYIPEVGMQDGWDGRYNGSFVNPGVYVYTAQVNFLDGEVLTYSGDVTLIR